MIGLLDIGGAMRGAYSAGVLDCFLQEGIKFDHCYGISAGAANISSFLAGQKGRNILFYTKYSQRKEYMSAQNLKDKKCLIDLDYMYSTLSNDNGECPLNFSSLAQNPTLFSIAVTSSITGEQLWFEKDTIQYNNTDIIKASSALPLFCQPQKFQGVTYFDGGVSNPIPIEKCLKDGCDRVVVILNRPANEKKSPQKMQVMERILKNYPLVAEQLKTRHIRYNEALEKLKTLSEEGRVYILAPEKSCGVGRLTTDAPLLGRYYGIGYHDALHAIPFIKING